MALCGAVEEAPQGGIHTTHRDSIAAGLVSVSAARAEQTCTTWMDQGDGTSWTTCVDDAGVPHRYRISNTPCSSGYEVSCSQ